MRILVFYVFSHAIQHKKTYPTHDLKSWGIWSDIRGLVPWMRCIFNCITIINCSIAILGARMPFHNLSHNLCNATMACCLQGLKNWWHDRIKNIIEKVQHHGVSLFYIQYSKYSVYTGSIIHMCIITIIHALIHVCIIILLYFITFCTSIMYYSCITIPQKDIHIII